MNEISICESCVNKRNIILCRACRNYDIINKGFQSFYVDENASAENLLLPDGKFFTLKEEDDEHILITLKNSQDVLT